MHWNIFILVTLIGLFLQVFNQLLFLFKFIPAQPKLTAQTKTPGVSIIKACKELQDNERENFIQFFKQDYKGPFEIIFVVSNESDPIVPIIREVQALYPKVESQLVISKTNKSFWPKGDALYDAHQVAKYPLVIWSDSDTWVNENYVTLMSTALQEPGVSVVTTPQYDWGMNNFATSYKLCNNTDIGTSAMLAMLRLDKMPVAWGHSLGFNHQEFKSFGEEAWEMIRTGLADDLMLPLLFLKHKKKVVFTNIFCPVHCADKTLKQVLDQKIRWIHNQKTAFIWTWRYLLLAPIGYPTGYALLNVVWTLGDSMAWVLLGITVAQRIISSVIFEWCIFRTIKMNLRFALTIWIWDLVQFVLMFRGAFDHTIHWRGKRYRLRDIYYLEPIN